MTIRKWIVGMTMLTLGLAGCVLPGADKSSEIQVALEIVPSRMASVSVVKARLKGEELVISGKVRKSHEFFLPGHVDIAICDPKGTMFTSETPRLLGYASKKGGMKEGRFTTRVKTIPPAGAKIRVRYHSPSSGEKHLECV